MPKRKKYHLDCEDNLNEISEELNFKFLKTNEKTNKHLDKNPPKMYIAKNLKINQYGLFLGEQLTLEKEIYIGSYKGKRKNKKNDSKDTRYEFIIREDDDENDYLSICAKNEGNETRFVNSTANNVNVIAKIENNTINFYLYNIYSNKPMILKKGTELLIDYGQDKYWGNSEISPLFLNPRDESFKTSEEFVEENKEFYTVIIDPVEQAFAEFCAIDDCENIVLLTTSNYYHLFNPKNPNIKPSCHSVNLPLILAEKKSKKILPSNQQARITLLMVSCYLGNEITTQWLVENGAYITDELLHLGMNPLMFLLKGKGTPDQKAKILMFLLKQNTCIPLPDFQDKDGKTILFYCLDQINEDELIYIIVNSMPLEQAKNNIFYIATNNNLSLFDFLIYLNKFEIAHSLLIRMSNIAAMTENIFNEVDFFEKKYTINICSFIKEILTCKFKSYSTFLSNNDIKIIYDNLLIYLSKNRDQITEGSFYEKFGYFSLKMFSNNTQSSQKNNLIELLDIIIDNINPEFKKNNVQKDKENINEEQVASSLFFKFS